MKKTTLALAIFALAGYATAGNVDIKVGPKPGAGSAKAQATSVEVSRPQVQVNAPTAKFPLSQSASATADATAPSKSGAGAVEVNPFTGANLNVEATQRELERSKANTLLLEEQLKQATLMADIANLPAKKRAELAQVKGVDAFPPGGTAQVVPAKPVVKVKAKAKAKNSHSSKKEASVELASSPAAVMQPVAPSIVLDGVVVNNGVSSAILSVNGNATIVANGTNTPFGQLQVVDSTSVRVGGASLKVHDSTIARVQLSDPKPVDPKAAVPFTTGSRATLPATMPAPMPVQNGKPPLLPPIPLPQAQ